MSASILAHSLIHPTSRPSSRPSSRTACEPSPARHPATHAHHPWIELTAAGAGAGADSKRQAAIGGPSSATTAFEPITPPLEDRGSASRRGPNGSEHVDIENDGVDYTEDPFHLAAKVKSTAELEHIRKSVSTRRTLGPLSTSPEAARARKLEKFYEEQNDNIERLLKPVSRHRQEAKAEADADSLQYKIAVTGSFVANIILAALQLYGAISSGSLSLFTTMADALFDPLSNVMLILSARAVKKVDASKFPAGKARIETAGNIVFCFLMCSVSFILIVFSIRDIATGVNDPDHGDTTGFHIPSIIAVGVALATKLSLFIYCFSLRNKYSQIRILWEDHRNDIMINSFGLLTSVGGSKLAWWIDPMGAIILSVLVAFLWLRTAYSEFQLLIGVTADTSMLKLITYISMTHSQDIIALDTVRAWHSGPRLIVEVDIVMDSNETLKETHDVAESLQMKLESLPDVDRAYVHVDFETTHAPEHFLKKEL